MRLGNVTLHNINLQNQGRGCNVVFIPKKIMLVVYLGVLPQYVTPFLYGNIIVYLCLIRQSQAFKKLLIISHIFTIPMTVIIVNGLPFEKRTTQIGRHGHNKMFCCKTKNQLYHVVGEH